ncbi:MAG TPA: chemotaxis response regulator protein-glutamate methylesterase [Spirochaetota bacterium]|nr:chemotaxis response regulator protein-glutamate methylesterase [Spirochaetota bacterium]HQO21927.1 chemotaxis response regulator protein-glutamate methylesterase [Spirochaetota bacterium]HQQ22303.1 chemotaxis response regulator protein-glutamate methylesterase [Spirochaetota bacterium]
MNEKPKIKVLVVDDSALVRRIITDALERDPEITVVGNANNGKTAVFKSFTLDPDVITMDIEMPIMNGLEALREIIRVNPKPVIMMSVLTQYGAEVTFKALEYGAVDFVPKPSSVLSMSPEELSAQLVAKVKAVAKSVIRIRPSRFENEKESSENKDSFRYEAPLKMDSLSKGGKSGKLVGIGASTGGPSALMKVFSSLPDNFPAPVLVVQHMPEGFTKAFAERLNSSSSLEVKEAEDMDKVLPGCGYIAPGHSHIILERRSGEFLIRLSKSEKVSGHRPSIDVMLSSIAENYTSELIGVIMTGMGRDGAEGISKIRQKGGYTVAQDEETSVVYGMNRVAVELGGVVDKVPLEQISKKIVEHL